MSSRIRVVSGLTANQHRNCASAGGYDFAASPDRSAVEQPIYWAPEVDAAVVHLVETPSALATGPSLVAELAGAPAKQDDTGYHLRLGGSNGCQISLVGGARVSKPLAAIIPLDAKAHDRLASVTRFIKQQSGHYAPDKRLAPSQRRRLGHMLRAVDGRTEGATYFDIAHALFGSRFVKTPDWQESSFRYTTFRLVRDGLKMVDGGYRQLLKFRRRSV